MYVIKIYFIEQHWLRTFFYSRSGLSAMINKSMINSLCMTGTHHSVCMRID